MVSLSLLVVLLFGQAARVTSVIPSGEMLLDGMDSPLLTAPAYWGGELPQEYETIYRKMILPQNGSTGCYAVITDSEIVEEGFYLMVERGGCSFEHKAHAAFKAGAVGLVVHNSPFGVYQGRQYANPEDYDCTASEGWVTGAITGPVWQEEMVSRIPPSCSDSPSCPSKRCLYTNTTNEQGTKVCCAWDLFLDMGPDRQDKIAKLIHYQAVPIPVVFVTMAEGDFLQRAMGASMEPSNFVEVAMFARPLPPIDLASAIIWLMAVAIVVMAAEWASRKEIYPDESNKKDGFLTDDGDSTYSEIEDGLPPEGAALEATGVDDESFDITPMSAVFFIGFASCTLLLFFFFDLSDVIIVIYTVGATLAIGLVFIYPMLLSERKCEQADSSSKKKIFDNTDCIFLLAMLFSAAITFFWYFNRSQSWDWLLQDFMGASVCLCFLGYVRLPNLQVASLLLTLAFFYDVFFVFITPFIFGSSVMVNVAQGRENPQHNDPNFCEKFPGNADCQDTTAPNLLVVPSISDYRGGECMLGLGDIILPGLFLVLTARIDVRQRGYLFDDDLSNNGGLFGIAILGYGLALIVANVAVSYFQFGQPALLYIVPMMLIPVLWRTHDEGTLSDLWEKLPLPRTVAQPVGLHEQQRLLANNDNSVVAASASWGLSTGELNIKVKKGRKRNKSKGLATTQGGSTGDSSVSP
jgi:signal peptide peptidase-like 2B